MSTHQLQKTILHEQPIEDVLQMGLEALNQKPVNLAQLSIIEEELHIRLTNKEVTREEIDAWRMEHPVP